MALDAAAHELGRDVHVVVAADSCRDATASAARATPVATITVEVIEGRWGMASAARRAATEHGLRGVARDDLASWWLASTDADSTVTPRWLRRQLDHAEAGALAVAGIVHLDEATPRALRAAFAATYPLESDRHRHVHAANLGVRADAYAATTGWSPHTMVGEDHRLWLELTRHGVPTLQPTDVVVITSGRTTGRAPGGFASNVARLERGRPIEQAE